VIFGLEPKYPLPEGWVPLEAATVVKCLDSEGNPALVLSHTQSLSSWESYGMLISGAKTVMDDIQASFESDDD